jgi:phage FluMu gp28-like protein
MSTPRKDALENLRARVESAKTQAAADVQTLSRRSFDELDALCKKHKLGTNISGWVNPYPADDPRSLLLEYQFHIFHDRSRFKLELMGRQTGKDFTGEGEAVTDCHERPKTEWMIAAPSERQSLDSLDQAKTWAAAYDLKIADYQESREGTSETLLKSAEVTFANGSRIRAVPGKPETVRGRSVNVGLTEYDFFENPALTWRAILPSITNPLRGGEKKVRIWTTPNGAGGAMQKLWEKTDGDKMRWSRHLVTIYHAVLMGLPVDIEELRAAFDDPDGFDQEFLCRFLDGSNVLLPYDIIQMAESAEATEGGASFQLAASSSAPTFCGIDFGRTTDPTVCWTLQRIGDVLWTREVLVLKNVSTPDQEQILKSRIAAASRVCFDYTGPGIGLGDYLVDTRRGGFGKWKPEEHEFGKIELFTFTTLSKRLLFPRLRQAFKDSNSRCTLRIPVSTAIREDLHEMQQVITNGEYNYWSRRTREGHSDRCTALALAVRAAGTGSAALTAADIREMADSFPHGGASVPLADVSDSPLAFTEADL